MRPPTASSTSIPVRLLQDYVDPARKQRWWDEFFQPEASVLNHNFQTIHNIANWQRCAVAQFALVYHNEALWHRAIDGKFGVRDQVARGITADYVWYEQSFHYNEFVVQALLTLYTEAGLYGRSGELAHEMVAGENLMLAPLYLRFPNGLLPNPADGTGIETAPHLSFLADTYRVFPTTLGLVAAASRRDWNTLVDPPPPSPRPDVLPEVKSQNLAATRMAVLKQGPWQVFLHYGQLTASHSQAEALNYSASYGTTDITHDPGTVGYGSPFHKEYYTRGLNHNVPLIDGEGEVPPEAGSPARLFRGSRPRVRRPAGLRPERRRRTVPRHRRRSAGRRRHHPDQGRLDARARTFAAPPGQGAACRRPSGRPTPLASRGQPPSDTGTTSRPQTCHDQASFDVDFGDLTLRVTIAVPGEFTIWHGSTPDVPPHRREGFYLETHGASATFTTTFSPVSKSP